MANKNTPYYNFMPTNAEEEKGRANMKVKNTSYYNFVATMAEEDAARVNNREHQVTRASVEMRERLETENYLGS